MNRNKTNREIFLYQIFHLRIQQQILGILENRNCVNNQTRQTALTIKQMDYYHCYFSCVFYFHSFFENVSFAGAELQIYIF